MATPTVSDEGLLSVRDWLALPETRPRVELINGKLVQKPLKTVRQSHALGSFLFACIAQLERNGWQFFVGGTGVYVAQHTAYIPDAVAFVPGIELDPDERVGGAPFLVAEIRLASTENHLQKRRDYARIGVQIFVLIDAGQKTMEVFRLNGNRFGAPETLRERDVWKPVELPGLELQLEKLWM